MRDRSGFQIIGDVDDAYSGAEEPALPAGAILYNDFSNYIYKDYSLQQVVPLIPRIITEKMVNTLADLARVYLF